MRFHSVIPKLLSDRRWTLGKLYQWRNYLQCPGIKRPRGPRCLGTHFLPGARLKRHCPGTHFPLALTCPGTQAFPGGIGPVGFQCPGIHFPLGP